jgi:hypothetical protein
MAAIAIALEGIHKNAIVVRLLSPEILGIAERTGCNFSALIIETSNIVKLDEESEA